MPYLRYKRIMLNLPTIQTVIPPDIIDLGAGEPSLSLIPLEMINTSAQKVLSQSDNSFLQYGSEQGDGHFRFALSQFLSKQYEFDISPEKLFITNGISNALDLICTLFTQAGDTIYVEEPTYFLAPRIFADHKLNIISIQSDDQGIDFELLEQKLKTIPPKFFYIIPTFQNPSGHTLSQEERTQLISLSIKYNFIIVADEAYQLLGYTQKPPSSFAAYTDQKNIIALGSFSKILAPGLRLGWLHAHPVTIQKITICGLLDSGGGLNPFTSALLRDVIDSGNLENNILKLKNTYSQRIQSMHLVLQKNIPEVSYTHPHGGYFFWLQLNNGMDATTLREKAKAHKVDIRQGKKFSTSNGLDQFFRISFAHYESEKIEEGILRLSNCFTGKE